MSCTNVCEERDGHEEGKSNSKVEGSNQVTNNPTNLDQTNLSPMKVHHTKLKKRSHPPSTYIIYKTSGYLDISYTIFPALQLLDY